MNLWEAQQFISAELSDYTDEAKLESRLIIQKATGLSRPVLFSHPEKELSAREWEDILEMCRSRKKGVPLPYLLEEWEFFGHTFKVSPSVLIPRPETELLVEEAESWLKRHPDVRHGFDIGTGSGCIAVSLLLDFPDLTFTAVDIQKDALLTAVRNAELNHCRERFQPVLSSLFSAFSAGAQLICANLPYIPTETCKTIEPARFEPITALDGGPDGFDLYRLLFQELQHKIKDDSLILCEIEYRQRETALSTAENYFSGRSVQVLNDLAGQPRLLRIE